MGRLLLLASLMLSAGSSVVFSAENIPFLTYHITPPFIVDSDARIGLTYDLADLLSESSEGQFNFVVNELPRRRLNLILEKIPSLVIPWVNPLWFKDPKMERYLWTSGYMSDSNVVLSSVNNPIEYTGPQSLIGKSLAGVFGGKWTDIDALVEDGQIKRINTSSYLSTMRMVQYGRSDATIIPAPVAKYLILDKNLSDYFHLSARPHSDYLRHFLVKGRPDIQRFLETQISTIHGNPRWKAIMASYEM